MLRAEHFIAPKDVKADCFPIVDNDVGKVGIFPNDPRDVRAEYLPIVDNDVGKDGNFPIAPKDVKTGNFHTALSDVGPGTFHTLTDITLHEDQVIPSYPRGPEEVSTRNSFSYSECFSGDISSLRRESKKTTCPALKPGSRGCPAAAYRAMLRLYIRLQDFRENWSQNWFLANILSKIQEDVRSCPTFSRSTSIYT